MKKHLLLVAAAMLLTACGTADNINAPRDAALTERPVTSGEPDASSGVIPDPTVASGADDGTEAGADRTGRPVADGSGKSGLDGTGLDDSGPSAPPSTIDDILNWNLKTPTLAEVLKMFDQNGIRYQGTYNQSMERVDVILEDNTRLIFLKTSDETGNGAGTELMMVNDQFNDSAFQEGYLNQHDVTSAEEYYPLSDEQPMVQEDLLTCSQTDLSIARNEIFARHGRIFRDPFLNAVYTCKSWYHPRFSAEDFAAVQDKLLNDYEKMNLKLLIEMEMERGFRKRDGENYEEPAGLLSGSWIDLDSDGTKEQITYEVKKDSQSSMEKCTLAVDGHMVMDEGTGLSSTVYTASLDETHTLLLTYQLAPGDTMATSVYTYTDGKLSLAGVIWGSRIRIWPDGIHADADCDHFQTFHAELLFQLQDGQLTMTAGDFYPHGNEAVARSVIPLYAQKGGGDIGVTLNPGDRVIILGSDMKNWVSIQKKDTGETGWLKCGNIGYSLYTCTLPDGTNTESYNLFDGLTFY